MRLSNEVRFYYKADVIDHDLDMAILSVIESMFQQSVQKLDCINVKLQVRYVSYCIDRRVTAQEVKDCLLLFTSEEVCVKVYYKTKEVDVLIDQHGDLEKVTRKNTPKKYLELL